MNQPAKIDVKLDEVQFGNDIFYRISNVDKMRPFFMSIVSESNHWLFIGSNGGLSAGRKSADSALFPYYTDDKIIESVESTGSKSIFQVHHEGRDSVWEPFSVRNTAFPDITRNLYKSVYGNKILFEEVNHQLNLSFQYEWNTSSVYGFVRKCRLENLGEQDMSVTVLDGLQNVMPFGVGSALQNQSSNLVDAYKRSELLKETGIGIFALSAIIVDKAEPSEALKANLVWSTGINNAVHLLSSRQLDQFRNHLPVQEEVDIKGQRGAYFISAKIDLPAKSAKNWMIIADVNKTSSAVAALSAEIRKNPNLNSMIEEDIESGTKKLVELNASADALQLTNDHLRDARHYSNTLFNIMRGGIFDNNYQIEKHDLKNYLLRANPEMAPLVKKIIDPLPEQFSLSDLKEISSEAHNPVFKRLCIEYMPLKFSRRHGDPSRPWNRFSINTHDEHDGSKILDYEGNWRDIFQNWEALAHSYPEFIEGMIARFLNASTFDGYNPYRITKNGIDWEKIEPDDPWSYIGYWGDHQVIYLLKFLEFSEQCYPRMLQKYVDDDLFVYANVPYRIKNYREILKNPKDTIDFDHHLDKSIDESRVQFGSDSALLRNQIGEIVKVNFVEKILATVLAKMSNFIPEGGIWMNTQRPEWNDANNALVGNGVSMVTLYYLYRLLTFMNSMFLQSGTEKVSISKELGNFLSRVISVLDTHKGILSGKINDKTRKQVLDGLGEAGSDYRINIYTNSFNGEKQEVQISELLRFTELCMMYAGHSIKANKRADNLYHAYNIMSVVNDEEVSISYLSEMLEGQVAVLSSGYLTSSEEIEVLNALKSSKLYRADQSSYLLYPNRELPGFMEKNTIPAELVSKSDLLQALLKDGDTRIIQKDVNGKYHFNGNFRNAGDLKKALVSLVDTKFATLAETGSGEVLQLFEAVFNHKAFTGRSGTFYGYEGLGSIYWHMVSKLALAAQECCLKAINKKENEGIIGKLIEQYYDINEGLGIHKSPELYGAYPTDPYSHTPAGKGAQQPGMTGQVKEDILCRLGELGIVVNDGKLGFDPRILRRSEFLTQAREFSYVNINGQWKKILIEPGSMCFTYCQIPVIYKLSARAYLEVVLNDGTKWTSEDSMLDHAISNHVFRRNGQVAMIMVGILEEVLQ